MKKISAKTGQINPPTNKVCRFPGKVNLMGSWILNPFFKASLLIFLLLVKVRNPSDVLK